MTDVVIMVTTTRGKWDYLPRKITITAAIAEIQKNQKEFGAIGIRLSFYKKAPDKAGIYMKYSKGEVVWTRFLYDLTENTKKQLKAITDDIVVYDHD